MRDLDSANQEIGGTNVVVRQCRARVRSSDADAYVEHVMNSAAREFGLAEGNLGHQVLARIAGNGLTEVVAISWWSSWGAIASFAGSNPNLARHFPHDDQFLEDRPKNAEHFAVLHAAGAVRTGHVLL